MIEVNENNTVSTDVKCGTAVTFTEFVDGLYNAFINHMLHDVHLLPSYKACLVCRINYTFVAKFEDYFNEIVNVLALNSMSHRIITNDIENKANRQMIIKGVRWLYWARNQTIKCLTVKEGLERFWNRLIARGILDTRSKLPFLEMTVGDIELLSREHIINITLKAYTMYNQQDRKRNREESMASVYMNLPEKSYKHIIHMFAEDFQLFDYDKTRRFRYSGDVDFFKIKS